MIREIASPLIATGVTAATAGAAMFAQMPAPKSEELFGWLSCAVAVMGIVYLGVRLFKEMRPSPRSPSIDVELKGMAKNERVAHLELTLPTLATKAEMGAMEQRIDQRRSQGIGGLHGRINEVEAHTNEGLVEVGTTLARVEANTETNTAAVQELSRKIDVILQRLPRTRS